MKGCYLLDDKRGRDGTATMTNSELRAEALLKPGVVSKEEKELRDWLKLNRGYFVERECNATEIAHFAFMNNFNRELVYAVLSDFTGAMTGTTLEGRAAFRASVWEGAVEKVANLRAKMEYVKELDMMPLWKDLAMQFETNA